MVRVAYGIGRNSVASARQAGLLTFAMGVGWLVLLIAVPLKYPEPLVRIFLDESDPGFSQVLSLTTQLLYLAAFFQIFDGLQVVSAGVLRGAGDTRAPLLVNIFGFWCVGLPTSLFLAFRFGFGPQGLWWGLVVGLVVVASFLLTRVAWKFRGSIARIVVE